MKTLAVVGKALHVYRLERVNAIVDGLVAADESRLVALGSGSGDKLTNILFKEGDKWIVYQLSAGQYSIGRALENDVRVGDETVSRFHAVLNVHDDGRVTLRDLNSSNGSRVDWEEVEEEGKEILPGQSLVLGLVELKVGQQVNRRK